MVLATFCPERGPRNHAKTMVLARFWPERGPGTRENQSFWQGGPRFGQNRALDPCNSLGHVLATLSRTGSPEPCKNYGFGHVLAKPGAKQTKNRHKAQRLGSADEPEPLQFTSGTMCLHESLGGGGKYPSPYSSPPDSDTPADLRISLAVAHV